MTLSRRTTPHLFDQWDRITKRIRTSKRLVLFLDFDGTLVPIAPMPDRARLANVARRTLQRLATHKRVALAVISARRRKELQRFIGIRGIEYLGLYGWEQSEKATLSSQAQIALLQAHSNLLVELSVYRGVWIEPKQFSFSIHLLGTSAQVQRRVRRRVETLLEPLHETLRVFTNLRDIEVVPASIRDKGAAVREFLERPTLRGALSIYFGDDLSDEPGFSAVRKGISVLVGKRRATRAQFFLRGPAEVEATLSRMEAIL